MCKGLAGSYLCVIVLENLLCTRFTACNYDNKSFWVTPTTYAARTLYYPTNDRFSILLHFPSKFGHGVVHTKVEGNDLSYNDDGATT